MNAYQGIRDRPIQCHKCLEYGHLKGECTSDIDRSMACYKCGQSGHRVATCVNDPRCILCPDMQNGHRMGSKTCNAVKEANVRREGRRQRRNNKRKKKPMDGGNVAGGSNPAIIEATEGAATDTQNGE